MQSIYFCICFAGVSGAMRVAATMVLAYPAFLARQGLYPDASTTTTATTTTYGGYLACHLCLLFISAVLSILSTIYGPVSVAVPVQTCVFLLVNVVVMGIVLQMRAFNKAQRTGTYVVFFSVLSLVDIGPSIQENQDARLLFQSLGAIAWSLLVIAVMVFAAAGTIHIVRFDEGSSPSWFHLNSTLVLGTGVTMSNVAMATSSKTFASLQGGFLLTAGCFYLFSTILGVLFSVVSSTKCEQGVFTPLSSVALILTNMVTGVLVWEDGRTIVNWVAYLCACFLMICGVYLLAEIDVIEQYRRRAVADAVLQQLSSDHDQDDTSTREYTALRQPRLNSEESASPSTEAWCEALEFRRSSPSSASWAAGDGEKIV